MSMEIEHEERVMLTEKQYLSIVSFYLYHKKNDHFIHHKNVYFDTDDMFLLSQGSILRLRTTLHRGSKLTLKTQGQDGDLEISQKLSYQSHNNLINHNQFPKGDVYDALLKLGRNLNMYHPIGYLITRRLEIKEKDHLLVIDKNEYEGVIDYNLEIEAKTKDDAKRIILQYCEKFSIPYQEGYINKSNRLFNKLKEG